MVRYGYIRVSRKQQSIERQERNIKSVFPDAVIIKESFTGTIMDRPEWQKLYKRIQPGDEIIFDSVSRMSRNAKDGFEVYKDLYQKGVKLVFLKEPHINTDVYKQALEKKIELTGKKVDYILRGINEYLMALAEEQIKIAFEQSEKEINDLRQRTKEGIETARLSGKQIGGIKGKSRIPHKKGSAMKDIKRLSRYFEGSLSDIECIKLIGINRKTFYKYKKELFQDSLYLTTE